MLAIGLVALVMAVGAMAVAIVSLSLKKRRKEKLIQTDAELSALSMQLYEINRTGQETVANLKKMSDTLVQIEGDVNSIKQMIYWETDKEKSVE